MLVYMDLCCFNRPFDDQSQPVSILKRKRSSLFNVKSRMER